MSVELEVSLRKIASKNGVELLLTFSGFYENTNQSIIYCQTLPLDGSLMYIVKTLCQASLSSFLI